MNDTILNFIGLKKYLYFWSTWIWYATYNRPINWDFYKLYENLMVFDRLSNNKKLY
jgi:hypothetical protein